MRVCVCVCVCVRARARAQLLSYAQPFAIPQTVAHQASVSIILCPGLSKQEYWSGLPFPLPGCLTDPRIEPMSPMAPALAGRFFTTELSGTPQG